MRVAVLGLGSAGRRHAGHAAALGHDVAGWDPQPGDHGVATAASAAAAIEWAEAVIVASPNVHHAEQAAAALRAGRPVLVEKPLAMTVAEASGLVELAERERVPAGVAMNLRFHPAILALRELLASGELGPVRLARASFGFDLRRWRPGTDWRAGYSARADLGGGVVMDAIHEIDYLLWLLGPVDQVLAATGRLSGELAVEVEDTAAAVLTFASGTLATLDLNFFEARYRRGCLLVGERATATWDWGRETIDVEGAEASRTIPVAADLAALYRAEVEDFLAAAQASGTPRASLRDGLAGVRVASAVRAQGVHAL